MGGWRGERSLSMGEAVWEECRCFSIICHGFVVGNFYGDKHQAVFMHFSDNLLLRDVETVDPRRIFALLSEASDQYFRKTWL